MSWGGTKSWSLTDEPVLGDANRIERNLDWLYERVSCDVGLVGYFPVSSADRHLLCNGATISKTSEPEYTELVNHLKAEAGGDSTHPYYHADQDKAKVPDLDSVFIRGMMSGRKSGEYQGNALRNHLHQTVIGSHDHEIIRGDGVGHAGIQVQKQTTSYTPPEAVDTSSTDLGTKTSGNPTSGGATESRPDNVTLYPLIMY